MRIKVGAVLTAAFVLLYEAVIVVAVVGEVMIGPEGGPESGISSSVGDDANHRRKTQKKNSKASNKVTKSEKKKIKKASKKAPTRSPTPPPTKPPTLQPTKNPTDSPTKFRASDAQCLEMLDYFTGIDDCYSLDAYHLMIEWDMELYDEGCRGVKYHILMAEGTYDYSNTTEEQLIDIFSKDPNFYYEEQVTENYFYRKKLNNTGEYSALVFAEIDTGNGARAFSRSSKQYSPVGSVKPCIVSQEQSLIKEGVVLVGPFVPTVNTTITVENTSWEIDDTGFNVTYSQLIFEGPLGQEAKDLQVGNIVTAATNDLDWHKFIIGGITTEDIGPNRQKKTFDVKSAQMADVFETYDANVNADVNKRDFLNYKYNCESEDADCEGRARRKLQRRVARRLGFWSGISSVFTAGVAFVKDKAGKLVEKATEFIGDAISTAAEAIDNVVKIATGQELNKSYRLVKIDEKWSESLEDLIIFDAAAKFDVDVIAQFKVNSKYIIELKAAYEFTAGANFKEGDLVSPKEKTYPIGKLDKFSKLFMIGPVPLEIYAQPTLEGQLKLDEFSLAPGKTTGPNFTYKGQTSAKFGYDKNGKDSTVAEFSGPTTLKKEFVPPKFDGLEVTLDVSMSLIFTAAFGLYRGLIEGKTKLIVGPRLYAVGGVRTLEDVTSSTSGRALLALPAESSDSAGIQNSRALISSTSTEPSNSINQVALMESPYLENTDRHNLRVLAPRSGESIEIFYIKTMDLDFNIELNLTGNAFYNLVEFPEASLYTKSFPMMRLPSVNITNDPINCVDGVPTGSLVAAVDPKGGEPSPWISNDVKKDGATWYYSTATTEGWTFTSKENDKASLGFSSSSGEPTCPVGPVYYVVEANFPPLLKIITEVELPEDNCGTLECSARTIEV